MYELTPEGFTDKRFEITLNGMAVAQMDNSGNPERDQAVLKELVEAANRGLEK